MNTLDVIILVIALAVSYRGIKAGFFRESGSLTGFWVGILTGAAIAPYPAQYFGSTELRAVVAIAIIFSIASLFGAIGEYIGISLAQVAHRWRLRPVDAVFGALFGLALTLVTSWLVATMFARLPSPWLQDQINRSAILHALDANLPPAPDIIARVQRLIAPNGFPRVFTGLEPTLEPTTTGPSTSAVDQAAAAGRASTVLIQGYGCGGLVEGSGFVVGPGLVATNAHVVAGISQPIAIDANGRHPATTVHFDPNLDLAILRVSNLAGPQLSLSATTATRGVAAAALGYPGGGPFTVSSATVLAEQTALGRNIYDRGLIRREIYILQTMVRPGNSGGPLITPDGTVIGIIFATSLSNDDVGYALASDQILPYVTQASSEGPVTTGVCAAE